MLRTGLDLTPIDRIRESIRNPRFSARVFSDEERAYFETKKDPASSMAACFAAKEAFAKALGTGVRGFSLNEVSVAHDEWGAPFLRLSGRALAIAEEKNLSFSLSLTHTDGMAGAVVVAYEEK